MSYKKFLTVFLVMFIIQAGAAWAAMINRGEDFGSFIRLRDRTVDTRTQISVFQPPPTSTKGFYILQFKGPVEESWKRDISARGVRFLSYLPDNAFVVKVPPSSFSDVQSDPNVKWIGEYLPEDRIGKNITAAIPPAGQTRVKNFVVKVFDKEDLSPVINSIRNLGGLVNVVSDSDGLNGKILNVTIDEAATPDISLMPSVESVELQPVRGLHNDIAVKISQMDVTPVWSLPTPLTGKGQVVGIIDTGIDTGDTSTIHPAFFGNAGNGQPKIKYWFTYGRPGSTGNIYTTGDWSDPHGHGTHTSGSLAGAPLQNYSIQGVAYDAQIVIQSALTSTFGLDMPGLNSGSFQDAYDQGARLHNDSWGDIGAAGQYNYESISADTFAWNHKDFLAVFSAGNDGADANSDGVVDLGSISPPSTAKDVLAVGASENRRSTFTFSYGASWPADFPVDPIKSDRMANNPNGMVAFSSRGPTIDGRIKPDVVAPGTWILSDKSSIASNYWALPSQLGFPAPMDSYFAFDGGTSMSAPLTTGAAAIVRQYYTDTKGVTNPSAALIKATIINGATNMYPGQYGTGPTKDVTGWPDNNQGWGRVDLARSVAPSAPSALDYIDDNTGLATGGSDTYYFTVASTTVPVRATLVWTDFPGSGGAGKQLVNDLDLKVVAPNGDIYHGNNPAKNPGESPANFDSTNNVEAVEIPVSGLTTGTLAVTVKAYNVPNGPQPYALVIRYGKGADNISPLNATYDKTGGSGSFTITVSGSWTAVSNDSWIHVTSGSSGTGVGTVDYSVDAYGGTGSRSGSITAGGLTFDITQNGVQTLTLTANPPEGGTVGPASGQYDYGANLSLQATPNPGYGFSGWTGDVTGTANPMAITMDSDKTVAASFTVQGLVLGYAQNLSTVTLTATMYYNGLPAAGRSIAFYDKLGTGSFALKGTATTDVNGVATKSFTATAGDHTAYAKFTTTNGIPTMQSTDTLYTINAVELTSPLNAGTVTASPLTFTWQPFAGATYYHLQVSTSSTFGTTTTTSYGTAGTTYDVSGLIPGKIYYWRVYADIPTGTSMYSAAWKFTYKKEAKLSLAFVGLSGATVSFRATLTEADGTTPIGGKSITFYENTNGGAFTAKGTATTGALTSLTPGVATKSWTTTAGNHNAYAKYAGDTIYAPVSTDPASMPYTQNAVVLTSPLNASTATASPLNFSWQAFGGATSYHLQVSTTSTFGATATTSYSTAGTTYDVSGLIPGKIYYWRVYADIPTGTSMYSATWKFTYKKEAKLSLAFVGLSGATVSFRATLTEADGTTPIGGKSITFYENTNGGAFSAKGTATTGALTSLTPGVATKSWATTAGNHNDYAKYAGDTIYAPVSTNPADVSYTR